MARLTGLTLLLLLAACGQDMTDQEKLLPDQKTDLFPDGAVNQAAPAGTVSRRAAERQRPLEERPAITAALLERGRQRYTIACAPCHGLAGDGDGIIPRHGFPHPPSYHSDRLRRAPAAHFVEVITHGYGVMYSYADRVQPADRWAIAAWIRALQLSQATPADWLGPEQRARVDAAGGGR